MKYSLAHIASIVSGADEDLNHEVDIRYLSTDTRTITKIENTLFCALPGSISDGHNYIERAIELGITSFLVQRKYTSKHSGVNFIRVENVLQAIQEIAAHHRAQYPMLTSIGITGSNGKTIIKEWAYQLLFDSFHIVKSPKSFNSQLGVPLSILQINNAHEVGLFEAGISLPNEMKHLQEMILPKIGIFTNIGSAHNAGFDSQEDKIREKSLLFNDAKVVIVRSNTPEYQHLSSCFNQEKLYTWGTNPSDRLSVTSTLTQSNREMYIHEKGVAHKILFQFTDEASFENIMHVISLARVLGVSFDIIKDRISRINHLHMRLEMTLGIDNNMIINDAYSADLDSLTHALDFMRAQGHDREKVAILSSLDQSKLDDNEQFMRIYDQCVASGVRKLYYISKQSPEHKTTDLLIEHFKSTEDLMAHLSVTDLNSKLILIKGARKFRLERISTYLSLRSHTAKLKINLAAIQNNYSVYYSLLHKETGIIAVIKASAYGSGGEEIAKLLEYRGVKYLAVAFADEGIRLRNAGINSPIMILNPDNESIPELIKYNLEPEIYSTDQFKTFTYHITKEDKLSIHLKLDTGMHRLGFLEHEVDDFLLLLNEYPNVRISTIFSHLASSDDPNDDAYSQNQFDKFDKVYTKICNHLSYNPSRHILNTAGISRFPNRQYDMVRLGIGMYGIDSNDEINYRLQKAHSLEAALIQIKDLKKGESVGYNRKTILSKDTKIGIVNIGYADGLNRLMSNGNYSLLINGKKAPILGNICMDLTIVDLTKVESPLVGDRVIIFDKNHSIEDMASICQTIPYEILSRISERVARVYLSE